MDMIANFAVHHPIISALVVFFVIALAFTLVELHRAPIVDDEEDKN